METQNMKEKVAYKRKLTRHWNQDLDLQLLVSSWLWLQPLSKWFFRWKSCKRCR